MLVRPCIQNAPGKNGELSRFGYSLHRRGAAQSLSKDQVEWLHLRPCLVPSWCGSSRTTWDCCWSWGIFGHPGAAAPATLPKGNRARKWVNEHECVGLHWTVLFMKLSLVCLPKVNVVFKWLFSFLRCVRLENRVPRIREKYQREISSKFSRKFFGSHRSIPGT